MHRFYLPVLPAVAMLGVSTLWQLSRLGGGLQVARAAAVALLSWALVAEQLHHENGPISTFENVLRMNARTLTRTRTARYVRANFGPQLKVAAGDVGVIGYLIPHRLFDTFGLNDEAYVHRFDRDRDRYLRYLFEHEQPDVALLVSRSADVMRPRYPSDAYLVTHVMGGRYELVHRELSPNEGYHYFVYARRGLKPRGARLGPEVVSPLDATAAVETAALALR
jgi:hypothetical protein